LQYPTLVRHFFHQLEALDEKIASQMAAGRCQHCDGRLHRSDYMRKPRGAKVAEVGDCYWKRHSLCCGKRGCRKRVLPPSLRFLGRRVYLEVVVVLASVFVQVLASFRKAAEATDVPLRTLRRWRDWWRDDFPRLRTWQELRARFIPPPPDETQLPRSLLARLGWTEGGDHHSAGLCESLAWLARLLAPLTTFSAKDGSQFVRAVCPATALG
jgi:hypothetical protein